MCQLCAQVSLTRMSDGSSQNTSANRYNGTLSITGIMKLFTCVLHMNNWEFNDEHYLQIWGTAMGSKCAPRYANIFMQHIEQQLQANAPCKPELYLRYIDNIICVFSFSPPEIQAFIDIPDSQSSYHQIHYRNIQGRSYLPGHKG